MVEVDHEGVPVPNRRMPVRVPMGLGSLPAFMLVLVVFVVDVQVLVFRRLVPVHEHARVFGRPQRDRGGGAGP